MQEPMKYARPGCTPNGKQLLPKSPESSIKGETIRSDFARNYLQCLFRSRAKRGRVKLAEINGT